MLGESVAAVAIQTSSTHWHVSAVFAAILGFGAVACVWWLYYDRQASVELHGSTMSIVVYSYAHIPLLIGLAAMSAGQRLLIERAGQHHLGTGASVAFLGGVVLYLLSLIGTRTVTVQRGHRLGISLKLVACAILVGLFAAESAVRPDVIPAVLAAVLAAVIYAERRLFAATS